MAWSALARSWDAERRMYHTLTLRIEDTQQPGWLVRLYDGDSVVGESAGETVQLAMAQAVERARAYLHDESIRQQDLAWVQA